MLILDGLGCSFSFFLRVQEQIQTANSKPNHWRRPELKFNPEPRDLQFIVLRVDFDAVRFVPSSSLNPEDRPFDWLNSLESKMASPVAP